MTDLLCNNQQFAFLIPNFYSEAFKIDFGIFPLKMTKEDSSLKVSFCQLTFKSLLIFTQREKGLTRYTFSISNLTLWPASRPTFKALSILLLLLIIDFLSLQVCEATLNTQCIFCNSNIFWPTFSPLKVNLVPGIT